MMRCLVFVTVLILHTAVLRAQNGDGANATAESGSVERQAANATESDVLIRTETGELVPLSSLVGTDAVTDLLKRSLRLKQVPNYLISSLDLSGRISGEVADLTVTMQVKVRSADNWVDIPLQLGETFLQDFEHSSEVPNAEAVLTAEEQNVRTWHLQGAGMHMLKMKLAGKARLISPATLQLNLSLPVATASHARLEFSRPVEFVRRPADGFDHMVRNELGVESVEFWGLSRSVVLSWNEVAQRVDSKPVIQVRNSQLLDLTTIPASMNGEQILKISGSPITEVKVRYPTGFKLRKVDAINSTGDSVLSDSELLTEELSSEALISLSVPVEGTLRLLFELDLAEGSFPRDISVTIPVIDGANVQTGDLDILFPSGLLVQQTEIRQAQRRRVALDSPRSVASTEISEALRRRVDLDSDPSVASTGFRLRSPESLITLRVEETESQYFVETEIAIRPEQQSVILQARFRVNVLRGSLLELPLFWAESSSQQWTQLPGRAQLYRKDRRPERISIRSQEESPDLLTLEFAERQSGDFDVVFEASASLESFRAGPVQLSCPQDERNRDLPVLFRLAASDDYRIKVTNTVNAEPLLAVSVSEQQDETLLDTMSEGQVGLLPGGLLLSNSTIPVEIGLEEQQPEVRASVQVRLQSDDQGLRIKQFIQFNIDYRDLSEVSLMVPDGIRPVVKLAGSAETLRQRIGPSGKSTFRLPIARRGRLEIEADWLWPLPPEADRDMVEAIEIPLIQPTDCTIGVIEAGTSAWSGLRVARSMKNWMPVYSSRFDAAWRYLGEKTAAVGDSGALGRNELTLKLDRIPGYGEENPAGPVLLLLATETLGGFYRTTQTAIYDQTPSQVTIEVPAALDLESIRWGGALLTERSRGKRLLSTAEEQLTGTTIWRIFTGAMELAEEPPVLQIACRQNSTAAGRLYRQETLLRPHFAGRFPAAPLIWSIGAEGNFSAVMPDPNFDLVSGGLMSLLPGGESAVVQRQRYLSAVVSPFSATVQGQAREAAASWLSTAGTPQLFFAAGTNEDPRLLLIPRESMLLGASLLCVLMFMVLITFSRLPLLVPILLTPAGCLAIWVLQPAWAEPIVPWVLLGIIPGLVAVSLQRQFGMRRFRFRSRQSRGELPSIFGFPEFEGVFNKDLRRGASAAESDLSAEVSR